MDLTTYKVKLAMGLPMWGLTLTYDIPCCVDWEVEFNVTFGYEIRGSSNHGTRPDGHGTGAGWAMKVGMSSPGINTETSLAFSDI